MQIVLNSHWLLNVQSSDSIHNNELVIGPRLEKRWFWALANSEGPDKTDQGLRCPLTELCITAECIKWKQIFGWGYSDEWEDLNVCILEDTVVAWYSKFWLRFNDTSTLVGHVVSSPREREKRDRRDSSGDEREGQGSKRIMNENEETEEIKTSPSTLPAARIPGLAQL